jgi:hypothetical protein
VLDTLWHANEPEELAAKTAPVVRPINEQQPIPA